MASSRASTAITWGSAASTTVSTSSYISSDVFLYGVEDWQASIQVNADNATTAAAGDYVDLFASFTAGDVLGDTGNDYDTAEHGTYLGRLDTYATDTPGEDPARATYPLDTAPLGFKLTACAPQANTRNIVLRAMVVTHKPQ